MPFRDYEHILAEPVAGQTTTVIISFHESDLLPWALCIERGVPFPDCELAACGVDASSINHCSPFFSGQVSIYEVLRFQVLLYQGNVF